MFKIHHLILSLIVSGFSFACDPCALYNASKLQGHSEGAITLSLSEQYSSYSKAKNINDNSIKNGELVKGYSTTQFSGAYDVNENLGFQVNLPLIARSFDEIQNYRQNDESDAGLGDISLLGSYSVINQRTARWTNIIGINAGIKLPTGDSGTLEELTSIEEGEASNFKHHVIGASAGGRALTLGTGSYDYILGGNILSRYDRYLLLADLQYTIRTEGDFNYEFADDLLWSVGPGYYFSLEHNYSLAGRISLSGESKGKDKLDNDLVKGSQISNLYVGPEVLLSFNQKIGLQAGVDFRVTDEDRDAQVVPDCRIRSAISYRF